MTKNKLSKLTLRRETLSNLDLEQAQGGVAEGLISREALPADFKAMTGVAGEIASLEPQRQLSQEATCEVKLLDVQLACDAAAAKFNLPQHGS